MWRLCHRLFPPQWFAAAAACSRLQPWPTAASWSHCHCELPHCSELPLLRAAPTAASAATGGATGSRRRQKLPPPMNYGHLLRQLAAIADSCLSMLLRAAATQCPPRKPLQVAAAVAPVAPIDLSGCRTRHAAAAGGRRLRWFPQQPAASAAGCHPRAAATVGHMAHFPNGRYSVQPTGCTHCCIALPVI